METMNTVTWNVMPCSLIKIYVHFQRNRLPPSLAQKVEATGTSETGIYNRLQGITPMLIFF